MDSVYQANNEIALIFQSIVFCIQLYFMWIRYQRWHSLVLQLVKNKIKQNKNIQGLFWKSAKSLVLLRNYDLPDCSWIFYLLVRYIFSPNELFQLLNDLFIILFSIVCAYVLFLQNIQWWECWYPPLDLALLLLYSIVERFYLSTTPCFPPFKKLTLNLFCFSESSIITMSVILT